MNDEINLICDSYLDSERVFDYWQAENTGWSGGSSWFLSTNAMFKTKEEAEDYNNRHYENHKNDDLMKYRVVHIIKRVIPYLRGCE